MISVADYHRRAARRAKQRAEIERETEADELQMAATADFAVGSSDDTLVGSQPPYAVPAVPGRTEDHQRLWLRRHGPELAPYGCRRLGGKRGRGVVYVISVKHLREALVALDATPAPKTEPAPKSNVVDFDRMFAEAGYRRTRQATK